MLRRARGPASRRPRWRFSGCATAARSQARRSRRTRSTGEDAGRSLACRVAAANVAGSAGATSGALGAAKSPEQLLAASALDKVATALGLPSAKKCLRDRYLSIRIKQPKGVRISAATVLADGKRQKASKVAGRFNSRIDVRALRKSRFTLRITVTTASGLKAVAQRRFTVCKRKR